MQVRRYELQPSKTDLKEEELLASKLMYASSQSLKLSRSQIRDQRITQPSISNMVRRQDRMQNRNKMYNSQKLDLNNPIKSMAFLIRTQADRAIMNNYKSFPKRESFIRQAPNKAVQVKANLLLQRRLSRYYHQQITFSKSLCLPSRSSFSAKPKTAQPRVRMESKEQAKRVGTSPIQRSKVFEVLCPFGPWQGQSSR